MNKNEFIKACECGDIEKAKLYLFDGNNSEFNNQITIEIMNEALIMLCQTNHLPIIKLILTSPKVLVKPDINASYEGINTYAEESREKFSRGMPLSRACEFGNLEIVRFLLTSELLIEKANIHIDEDKAFREACNAGHIEIVEYLACSPELKIHANIQTVNNWGFKYACAKDSVPVVDFLLESKKLKQNIDIHCNNDEGFKEAAWNKELKVVKYFIFEQYIEKTQDIKNYLKKNEGQHVFSEIERLFSMRDLKESLEKKLVKNLPNTKTIKKLKI